MHLSFLKDIQARLGRALRGVEATPSESSALEPPRPSPPLPVAAALQAIEARFAWVTDCAADAHLETRYRELQRACDRDTAEIALGQVLELLELHLFDAVNLGLLRYEEAQAIRARLKAMADAKPEQADEGDWFEPPA